MLIMDLLLPFTMIGFGRYFTKKAPKEINSVFGYRTSMSMKNKDTWEFAHKYCGKVWYVCGMVMLPITVIFMLLVIGKNEDCVGSMGGIICGVQLIPLIGSIPVSYTHLGSRQRISCDVPSGRCRAYDNR